MGEVFHDQKAKQRAADAFEATILSNALFVFPTKYAIGRSRPSDGKGPQNYQPFSGYDGSLLSFHVTQAFTSAAVIAEYWDNPWVSALAYGLAAGDGRGSDVPGPALALGCRPVRRGRDGGRAKRWSC